MQGLGIGRVVHYTVKREDVTNLVFPINADSGRDQRLTTIGQTRAAIVVSADDTSDVNLQVFMDGVNDGFPSVAPCLHVLSATYSENGEPGIWRWPPRA